MLKMEVWESKSAGYEKNAFNWTTTHPSVD